MLARQRSSSNRALTFKAVLNNYIHKMDNFEDNSGVKYLIVECLTKVRALRAHPHPNQISNLSLLDGLENTLFAFYTSLEWNTDEIPTSQAISQQSGPIAYKYFINALKDLVSMVRSLMPRITEENNHLMAYTALNQDLNSFLMDNTLVNQQITNRNDSSGHGSE